MIKVVTVNEKSGKVELTKEELEKMLNEAYQDGKKENSITSPGGGTLPIGTNPYATWEYKNPRWDYGTDDRVLCKTEGQCSGTSNAMTGC